MLSGGPDAISTGQLESSPVDATNTSVTKAYETKLETLESEKALTAENLVEWLAASRNAGVALGTAENPAYSKP